MAELPFITQGRTSTSNNLRKDAKGAMPSVRTTSAVASTAAANTRSTHLLCLDNAVQTHHSTQSVRDV